MVEKSVSHFKELNDRTKEEDTSQNDAGSHKHSISLAQSNLAYWFLGFGVSCIPILSRQLGLAVIKSDKAGKWWDVLGSTEAAFLAVPLIITAVYYGLGKKKKDVFLPSFILLLIIGCSAYAVIASAYEMSSGGIDFVLTAWFNIIFLGFVLIIRILQHISDIKGLN